MPRWFTYHRYHEESDGSTRRPLARSQAELVRTIVGVWAALMATGGLLVLLSVYVFHWIALPR